MSLIHQVLQDLDERRDVHAGQIAGYAEEQENHRLVIWPAVIVSLLSAALVVYFSDYLKAAPAIVNVDQLPVLEAPVTAPATPLTSVTVTDESAPVVVLASELAELEARQASASQPSDSEVVAAAVASAPVAAAVISVAEPAATVVLPDTSAPAVVVAEPAKVSKPAATIKAAAVVADDTPAEVSVVRRLSPDDLYGKAVNRYRSGDWQAATEALDKAIAAEPRMQFITLKQRIYLEQGMRDEFLDLFDAHSASKDIQWLSVAATGLHMFGVYSQAVQQYGLLMALQPEKTEWAIAQTQAQIDAGQLEAAKRNLRYLNSNYELSADQKRWVSYQQGVLR